DAPAGGGGARGGAVRPLLHPVPERCAAPRDRVPAPRALPGRDRHATAHALGDVILAPSAAGATSPDAASIAAGTVRRHDVFIQWRRRRALCRAARSS